MNNLHKKGISTTTLSTINKNPSKKILKKKLMKKPRLKSTIINMLLNKLKKKNQMSHLKKY